MTGLTVYQSHDDDFAKILRAPSGRQVLAFCDVDDEGKPAVTIAVVVNGATMKLGASYDDDDQGYDKRDAHFNSLTDENAAQIEKAALGALID